MCKWSNNELFGWGGGVDFDTAYDIFGTSDALKHADMEKTY
jgi:hypothetical protein